MTTPDPHAGFSQHLADVLGHGPALEPQHFTDLGNARRLLELHGSHFRECTAIGKTFIWDGARWSHDVSSTMYQYAQETILSLYNDAALLMAESASDPDLTPDERKALAERAEGTSKWARQSESYRRIEAMIALAKVQPEVQVKPSEWDVEPMLLNCLNGTIDLQTGLLHPHDRSQHLTKICPVAYNPAAGYQAWDDFLERIVPDPSLRAYLQRALGYSITGLTTEEKLFMPWGPTATGKSTLLRAVSSVLGDYAAVVDIETFTAQKAGGGARNDIARLAGKRFVLAMEAESARLATSMLKTLTGGDVVTARFLYHEFFEFVASAKIWIVSNTRPIIPDDDTGMWRRVSPIPLLEQIPELERDPGLKLAILDLQVAGEAVFKWLVDGCPLWLHLGLGAPLIVRQASSEYHREMDRLADFIQDSCIVAENAVCANTAIWAEYLRWCQANGERRPLGRKGFTQRLVSKGFTRTNSNSQRPWRGIGIAAEGNRQDALY